ncbi:Very-long-chain enoyl-CoA reductase [Gracilariopsis chorda]|uniref:Very-long-chain enoyl-CoA reductase n=1 Tax=Gracilariopsis chorda TaxID=448386 RepID=A0A2V3IVJ8_9FLOR|nr:Very-long-chain enoyl-CoA reductase [Gracilariopsis chorda]|eukprot:PXF46168.1 Very-long-chain enoyl-CoA reductase [Gracilariopsis chorda]
MKVSVQSRSGRDLGTFTLEDGSTLSALQEAFHSAHKKYYPDRQRFYGKQDPSTAKKPVALSSEDALVDDCTLVFKDLGPQILWKTVFIVEYLGPLLLYPLFYTQPAWMYGTTLPPSSDAAREVQMAALMAWTFHYAKREFETLFIHRFSHATMPLRNIFKNSFYYWGFAAYVAYFVNHPLYTPPTQQYLAVGLCVFYFMEVGNFTAHLTLRNLRPAGTRVRKIPRGGLFEFVSCPNYTFEIMAWLGFNVMTRTVAGILFMCAGAFQMILWAQGKHRRYKKEFDGQDGRPLYPPNRKIIFPFVY